MSWVLGHDCAQRKGASLSRSFSLRLWDTTAVATLEHRRAQLLVAPQPKHKAGPCAFTPRAVRAKEIRPRHRRAAHPSPLGQPWRIAYQTCGAVCFCAQGCA